MNFETQKTDHQARAGILTTRNGTLKTPFFMNVGTQAAIKGAVSMDDLESIDTQVLLCNTYHLHLRPGEKTIKNFGGLHQFTKWKKPILTDSGGFQVFSLGGTKVTDEGVLFQNHLSGEKIFMEAKDSIQIQHDLGADIIMAFDQCPPAKLENPAGISEEKLKRKLYFKVRKAVERTTDWAKKSLETHQHLSQKSGTVPPQIFGIIQGGCFPNLREKSLEEITALDFDGFALGGLAVGESHQEMYKVLDQMVPKMPTEKPRYLMGVGTPENLLEAIGRGIDMFDCVFPTRNARHGSVYTWDGVLKIRNSKFKNDPKVLDEKSKSPLTQKGFSRAYLHHLFRANEDLAKRYLSIQNLCFYNELMEESRTQIENGTFYPWKKELLARWKK